MSERFGKCKGCHGTGLILVEAEFIECGLCLGTAGFSGSADEWDKAANEREYEKDRIHWERYSN